MNSIYTCYYFFFYDKDIMYDMILILSLTNKEDRCDACIERVNSWMEL